jgi:hypothetical protein
VHASQSRTRVHYHFSAAFSAALLLILTTHALAVTPVKPARILPIGDGWAGSSINVVANRRHALFTHERDQFAAYYDARGYMVLARRKLGEERWDTRRTAFRGTIADAHNSISVGVDGAGFLHVSWDHHGQTLNYARSVRPGSLELGPKLPMTGEAEDRVTYPEFYRLPDGDLLFVCREGESGNGQVVLKRYGTRDQKWHTVQRNLLDGEGTRSAYWGLAVDRSGRLHLAWIWRESPDVASNHDLAYAWSPDGGVTWRSADGEPLSGPFTEARSDYAARIPQGSNLMNPPAVAVDMRGRPYITSYWSASPGDPPQFHLVRRDGASWRVERITKRTDVFTLQGAGTKRPPISRAALFVQGRDQTPQVHIVYRDDARGGRAILVSTRKVGSGEWNERELTQDSLGAWEPVFDPVQWDRLQQVHLLVQRVQQADGDDARGLNTRATPIGTLVVRP